MEIEDLDIKRIIIKIRIMKMKGAPLQAQQLEKVKLNFKIQIMSIMDAWTDFKEVIINMVIRLGVVIFREREEDLNKR